MPDQPVPDGHTAVPVLEHLDEAECLSLIAPGGIGRIAYTGRYDLTVLPVNYKLHDGAIYFRTAEESPTVQDLRTGIDDADYRVAFEVDDFDHATREGWSVLIQGPAYHLDDEAERADAQAIGLEAWPGGERDHFIRISPLRVSGRRIRRAR
ncbi:MAG TPA: pyridoxamine 5'-phosphate oxidase family protein [Streptosporangiaceae bacterium]|nr:pyridoxamine 5'-phosphate oxidase family protein [Streptosporangiaceae bacterium]